MAAATRLLPNHPALRRIEEMFALMEERRVGFEFDSNGTVYAIVDGERFRLRDLEHRAFEGSGISELPPATEYAIMVDKER
jgi:hypothetical protein